jgi:hypothetical protein
LSNAKSPAIFVEEQKEVEVAQAPEQSENRIERKIQEIGQVCPKK